MRTGCLTDEVSAFAERIGAVSGGHNLFSAGAVEQVMASIRRIVAEYEIKAPLALGIPARTLREGLRVRDELADIAIREMEGGCEIESFGPVFRRPGWVPTPNAEDSQAVDRLAHDICAAVSEPPSVTELVSRYGSSVPALLRFLERQGRIVQVETDRYYDRDAVERLVARLRAELTPGSAIPRPSLRDVLGFTEVSDSVSRVLRPEGYYGTTGCWRVLRDTTGLLLDTSEAHS